MKKNVLIFLLGTVLLSSVNLMAQNWVNGGNTLSTNGSLGTKTNFSFLFKTNNFERGRISNTGLWGFGTTTPNARVHINAVAGQVPFRVENNGFTKLLVNNGVTIGANVTPPSNGLFVFGNTGLGTANPKSRLHVFNGSAGVAPFPFASLIVENSNHNFINILAPEDFETGILFGKPASNISGGITYNTNNGVGPNSLQFRTRNQVRMVLDESGSLGINTNPGNFMLKIKSTTKGLGLANDETPEIWEIVGNSELQLYIDDKLRGRFDPISGFYASISDERLKTNIKPMGIMLEKIMLLKPSTYQFKDATNRQEYNGFIAQEVMKLFPAMVAHSVNPKRNLDVYTMDYSQFGVLAIKGIQELQPVIEEQQLLIKQLKRENEEQKLKNSLLEDRLAKLEATITTITANKNGNITDVIANASLEQNQPNPFDRNTTIRYRIPQGSKGQINIYDQTGKIVKALNANESGQSELNGNNLAAGTYIYTLIINGKAALSRQMLITK